MGHRSGCRAGLNTPASAFKVRVRVDMPRRADGHNNARDMDMGQRLFKATRRADIHRAKTVPSRGFRHRFKWRVLGEGLYLHGSSGTPAVVLALVTDNAHAVSQVLSLSPFSRGGGGVLAAAHGRDALSGRVAYEGPSEGQGSDRAEVREARIQEGGRLVLS